MLRTSTLLYALGSVLLAAVLSAGPARAASPDTLAGAEHVVLVDIDADAVLYTKDPEGRFTPASLTKLMTALVVFDEIRAGRLAPETEFTVSEDAWRRGGAPSRTATMFAALGSKVSVSDLLQGLIVQLANDAALVLAEGIAGSEAAFVDKMNERAKAIGMTGSQFRSATGLPTPEPQYVTARDLATLARHLRTRFPEFMPLYAQPEFTWNRVRQLNRNPLFGAVAGIDGMGAGGTEDSGFGVVGSVVRDGRRLLLVLGGAENDRTRIDDSRKLIDWGYDAFQSRQLFAAGETIVDARVFGGTTGGVGLAADRVVAFLAPKGDTNRVTARIVYEGPLLAPVAAGTPAGVLKVWRGATLTLEVPLHTTAAVERGGIVRRAMDGVTELARDAVHAVIAKVTAGRG
jgi:serine-type D-Ala-D-Ala carboxypeptidase (penicillin-binding protein 5/6)